MTTKAVLAEVERIEPEAGRHRLALGDAAAGPEPAPLPPADPGPEAVLHRPRLHGAAARRQDLARPRTCNSRASPTACVTLEQLSPEYGAERRRLRVTKLRGQQYRGGYHDFIIAPGRPRRLPQARRRRARPTRLARGLLVQRHRRSSTPCWAAGSSPAPASCCSARPACGKSTLAAPVRDGRGRPRRAGRRSSPSTSSIETILRRTDGPGHRPRPSPSSRAGSRSSRSTRPSSRRASSPTPSADAVEPTDGGAGARVVVIDSLNGYLNAMPEERFLIAQLHELLTYLGHQRRGHAS